MNTYRNPWHRSEGRHHADYGPEFYSTDAKPTEYRGFQIFCRHKGLWELVKDGVCLTQRAGKNGPRNLVDALYGDTAADSEFNVERARDIAAQFGVTLPTETKRAA